jgi:hypothetical protein
MAYVPLNLDVYTAAYAGAIAGIGIPSGAFIVNPNQSHYAPVTVVAAAFAQAFDTAWSATPTANLYDIEAIAEACCNTFVKGPGAPMTGDVTTQDNWTIVATAIVALIKEGDAAATTGGIVFPPFGGGGGGPVPQQYWVAPWGSNTTGTGSIFLPFQTIAHTQSIITDAAANKIYEVILYPGSYTEDVPVKAFVKIVGFDPTQTFGQVYPARINGDISLGTGYGVASAAGWLTNLDIDGVVDLNFPETGTSADAGFSITNCQLEDDCTVNLGPANFFEFHGSTLFGGYEQRGGGSVWENTAGAAGASLLHVLAVTGSGATLRMYDCSWMGDIHADQNGNTTAGQVVNIEMFNSQARNGTCTITSATNNLPIIDGPYGALPENPVLTGAANAALSRQMRVSEGLSISATPLPAGSTNILIPLPGTVLGATSIEQMSCSFTPVGSGWGTVAAAGVTWAFYVRQNGATSEVHVVFTNTTDTPSSTGSLGLLFYAFYPNVIGT